MARAKRLYRSEIEIDEFGFVLLEIKESGIRLVSRERPGEVHVFPWQYLRKVCKCPTCTTEGQIKMEWIEPSP